MDIGRVTDAAFGSRRQQGFLSPVLYLSLGIIAFPATCSKLDKDFQKGKEHCTTRHRDMACRLIAVSHLNYLHSPPLIRKSKGKVSKWPLPNPTYILEILN